MSVSVSGNMHIFGCSKAALAIFWVGLAKYGNLHNHATRDHNNSRNFDQ